MANLTSKERSFLAMMGKSEEHARKGFDLLLKRPDFLDFFDPLIQEGFFQPERNPAPSPGQEDGYFQIPYWKALDFLTSCAQAAGQEDNSCLANKVMEIVRAVSKASATSPSRDNYHTCRQFAEILGLLPIHCISKEDLELVQGWLSTKFDRIGVVHALDEGVMGRLLASDGTAAWQKALQLTDYCTEIRWKPSPLRLPHRGTHYHC